MIDIGLYNEPRRDRRTADAPWDACPKDRLLELSRVHPERRAALLRTSDGDYPTIQAYLMLHPERRPAFLAQAIREGRVTP